MEVLVSPEIELCERVQYMRDAVRDCTRNNDALLAVGDSAWELIALIVPGENPESLMVTFAMRAERDQRIRMTINARDNLESIPVEQIIQSTDGYLDPEMYLSLIEQASEIAGELNSISDPNVLH